MERYVSYQVYHSPWGAYSSFVLGELGRGGGFAINHVRNPEQNVYIGYKTAGAGVRLFPFCKVQENDYKADFGVADGPHDCAVTGVHLFSESEITRELDFTSDTFRADKLSFRIYMPFGPVPDITSCGVAEFRPYCVPGVLAELTMDNTGDTEDAELFFGMNALGRLIGDFSPSLAGGALTGLCGFAVEKPAAEENIGFNPLMHLAEGGAEKYRLGREVLVRTRVPAGGRKTLCIALGTYQSGIVTSGLPCSFAYTRFFADLEDVLGYVLSHRDDIIRRSEETARTLRQAQVSAARSQMLALGVHSYLASSELLVRADNGQPLWVVSEGEYRMMNTLDLTVDHLFFELKYHAWTIRNVLEFFYEKYAYTDSVTDREGRAYPGGISFTHDCGVANMFSAFGTSAYEFEHVGDFSYMAMEQLLNWSLCASVYTLKCDGQGWKPFLLPVLKQCFQSLVNRDRNGDGVMDCDSDRCLEKPEITTYDSLDSSLSQARNNLYVAVKTFGALLCMAKAFARCGEHGLSARCEEMARRCAATVAGRFMPQEGYIPSIFEGDDVSKIIPAIEGLVYPLYVGDTDAVRADGRFGGLIRRLGGHLDTVLREGSCLVPGTMGWRLSSNSVNSWMSKIFISQYVSERVFGRQPCEQSDETHRRWQFKGAAAWCAADQIDCVAERPLASKQYPRLVTAILFWDEPGKGQA